MSTARSKTTTTARGLGWKHQQDRARLLSHHHNGTPCWWCDLPMFREPEQNWDNQALAADHSQPRALGGQRADRLLHGICNKQRQTGRYDHIRPAVTGVHPSRWSGGSVQPPADVGLAMDW